jgi:hypothetical protein
MINFDEIIRKQNEILAKGCYSTEDRDNLDYVLSGKYFHAQRLREKAEVKIYSHASYRDKLKALYNYIADNFKYIDKFARSKNHGWDVKMYTCEQFERYGGGCCHDFANYIYHSYSKLEPDYNLIFVHLYFGFIVHSYITFKDKYLMEFIGSNKRFKDYRNKKELINYMSNHLLSDFDIDKREVTKINNYSIVPPNTNESYLGYCDKYRTSSLVKKNSLILNSSGKKRFEAYFH